MKLVFLTEDQLLEDNELHMKRLHLILKIHGWYSVHTLNFFITRKSKLMKVLSVHVL